MPTGYTAKLMEEGQTFQEFVMTCARAFGALISLREEPLDSKIPDKIPPSSHAQEAYEKAAKELHKLAKMSAKEAAAFGKSKKQQAIASIKSALAQNKQEYKRLENMEKKVNKWNPPTPDHIQLKNFMLEQINISKSNPNYWSKQLTEVHAKRPMAFYEEAVGRAQSDIEYYRAEAEKAVKRNLEQNEWLSNLRKSLEKK